ncbi:MAG: head morphogenesis protein [Nitratireductor sp.]|uniref:phage minor head protein n=1 Tax=Nitratireductor sp. TaxID=1872084 RepID=UPI00262F6D21|nr:phage minor head protein [Nitratireductor sp.]MCV0348458.1 head morphogenesis protein [Nitratireductor sp.]
MLKRLSAREQLARLALEFEPKIRQAFLESIAAIKSDIVLRDVIIRLERGDVNGAIDALHLDRAAFRPVERAIAEAFEGGGAATVSAMPVLREPAGGRAVMRFDVRAPSAESWLSTHSSRLVSDLTDTTAIRARLVVGLERGLNPRAVALDIVGRLSRVTGQREGGTIGLTAQQALFVDNPDASGPSGARQQLLSGDPEQLREYLRRGRRDKRFDRTVTQAIREEKPLPKAMVDKIVSRYQDRLLLLRGETIAPTETLAALNQSQQESYQQAIDKGLINRQDVRKVWKSAHDSRVRHSHQLLDGESVGFDEAFATPLGNRMRFPGDTSLGASAADIVNCRCRVDYRIDFLANLD